MVLASSFMHPSRSRTSSRRAACGACSAALLWLACLLAAPLAAQPPIAEDTTLRERIVVTETSLLVDLGADLTARQIRKLVPSGLVVIEDGAARDVLRLSPVLASQEDSWELVLYFDAALSEPDNLARGATTLGGLAQDLTFLGSVRVLIADPTPRELLRSRSAVKLQDVLARLAHERSDMNLLEQLRERFSIRIARGEELDQDARLAALHQELELVRGQADHLLRLAGEDCPASACALFLASDGFHVAPEVYYLGEAWAKAVSKSTAEDGGQGDRHNDPHDDRPSDAAGIAYELAETLSALEWITVVTALRPAPSSEAKPVAPPGSDFDRYLQERGTFFDGIKLGRRRPSAMNDLPFERWDVYLLPVLQPLRMIAAETSGAILRDESQLAGALRSLYRRHRAWYRTPRPLDGRIRPVEARLSNGRHVDSPLWVDSSTPEGVAAARARGLHSGASGRGEVQVAAGRDAENASLLKVEVEWGESSSLREVDQPAPVRVSLGWSGEDGSQVRHAIVSVEPPSDGRSTFELELGAAASAERLAVVVEDLRYRTWGGTLAQ